MKAYLFLDDIRNPYEASAFVRENHFNTSLYLEDWIIVRDYQQFVNWISQNGLPEIISLDHDLGDTDTRTGFDCAKWLVNYCIDNNLKLPKWIIHYANPVGYDNIKGLLTHFERWEKD